MTQSSRNTYQKYGSPEKEGQNASWAIVTGGSDGIGLEICKKLSKEGFNICMVARNESKMKEKLEDIKREAK